MYGPFANYLQIACHNKAKIKEETPAGHRIQIFLIFFDEIQIIFMVLVHLHYVHSQEILNCTLMYHLKIQLKTYLFVCISYKIIRPFPLCTLVIFVTAFSPKFDSHDSNAYRC